jgi:hypothetical protein
MFGKVAKVGGMVAALGVLVVPSTSFAGRGAKQDPPCSVSANPALVGESYVVSASGIPTGTAVNLWVTDPNGVTVGSPLGNTPDGTFNLSESSGQAGVWTYEFSGPTKQKNTVVYSTCSVQVNPAG